MCSPKCSPNAHAFLRALPKAETHCHIEGTLEPTLLFELAHKNKIALDPQHYSTVAALEARYNCFTSLDDFLFFFNAAMDVLVTEDDFKLLTLAYLERVHRDGLVHAEIFFDPQAHVGRGVPLAAVVAGIKNGLDQGRALYGITSKLIMCFVRHLSVESALEAVESVREYVESGVIAGLGCDSTEKGNPPEKYLEVYKLAREIGFTNLTSHSGEEGPAAWVRQALELGVGINRIDHGVRSVEDPEVLKLLAERGSFLTVCPLSNVRLCVKPSVAEVPIPALMAAGVKFSINSDDPAYFGGYILDNYVAVHEAFGFTKEVWKSLVVDSVEGCWCGRARKDEILSQLESVMMEWHDREI